MLPPGSFLPPSALWPCAPSAVPTCRHPRPAASLWGPLSELVTCRAGRDAAHRGGRAPGRVEHWHRTCTLSDQHPCSPADGISPLQATVEQLKGLPSALIQVAASAILRDEGEAYGRKLDAAGVTVTTVRYDGMIHDYGLLNG